MDAGQLTRVCGLWRWLVATACSALLLGSGQPVYADEDGYVPGEVLVRLASVSDLPAISAAFNLNLLGQFGSRPIYRMAIGDGMPPPVKADALRNDSRVVYAEPNYIVQIPEGRGKRNPWVIGGDAGTVAAQWAPGAIRLSEAHGVHRGAGVVVAVLDTGVDASHPALAGRLVTGYDFVDDDADPREEGDRSNFGFGHGTHVAGLVALVAPEARIMPVRVLNPEGMGNVWVLAEALSYAVDPDGNPATDDGARVINMSLGTTRRTDLLDDIVKEVTCTDDDEGEGEDDDDRCARTGGVVVVAAAGNQGNEIMHYPAAEGVNGLLAVAASNESRRLADFSTRGSWVHIAAPGENIYSTVPGGAYGVWSGTSMAAPIVAGAAALLRGADSSLTADAVAQRLTSTSSELCATPLRQLDVAAALSGSPAPGGMPCQMAIPLMVFSP
jgi:thermitase